MGTKRVWLEKDYGEWQMWGRLVENILSAQGEVGGGEGGALRKGADGKQHTKDNEAGLPVVPWLVTSQLPLQAWFHP